MSLNYAQICHLANEIKPLIAGAECLSVSSPLPWTYLFTFRKADVSRRLLFSFAHGMVRFHLIENTLEGERKDPFAKGLQEKLSGSVLNDLSVANEDRIVSMSFAVLNKEFKLIAELVPRRPNCLLIDAKGAILLSLHPTANGLYAFPEKPAAAHSHASDSGMPLISSYEAERHFTALEEEKDAVKRKAEIDKLFQQRFKKAEKRVSERRRVLEECRHHAVVRHEAELLQANLYRIKKGAAEIVVADWEHEGAERMILLDQKTEPALMAAQLFRKAKRLEAGIPHAEEQLKKAESDLAAAETQLDEALSIINIQETERYARSLGLLPAEAPAARRPKRPEPAKPYHRFLSDSGMEIWVGKSAKDNDLLTFRHANGLDWWLHANDCPGSHVVLRCGKGMDPDPASIADAAELALRFSKHKDQKRGEVCLTQVKGIMKVKGSPGKVMLSKHKTLSIDLDEGRWNRLRHAKM